MGLRRRVAHRVDDPHFWSPDATVTVCLGAQKKLFSRDVAAHREFPKRHHSYILERGSRLGFVLEPSCGSAVMTMHLASHPTVLVCDEKSGFPIQGRGGLRCPLQGVIVSVTYPVCVLGSPNIVIYAYISAQYACM